VSVKNADRKACYGIAVDLGTTTIAVYLCNTTTGRILSSLAVKNPQVLYGDDIMSRIGAIGQKGKNLGHLQKMVVRAIEWGAKGLLASFDLKEKMVSQMVIVGNPTMIHILASVDPKPIGVSPYQPAFYKAKTIHSNVLGFQFDVLIQILPQISGFIGGDILSAGAFGTFLDKKDMIALGMIPSLDLAKIETAGNLAGAGAVMILCNDTYLKKTIQLAKQINVVDLACDQKFQPLLESTEGFDGGGQDLIFLESNTFNIL